MSEAIELVPAAPRNLNPAAENLAVARCCEAWTLTFQETARREGEAVATVEAEQAYRKAMPPLSGAGNIRDFIACTAHGMLIGAIGGPDGARLLYAAQVAYSTLRSQPAKQNP